MEASLEVAGGGGDAEDRGVDVESATPKKMELSINVGEGAEREEEGMIKAFDETADVPTDLPSSGGTPTGTFGREDSIELYRQDSAATWAPGSLSREVSGLDDLDGAGSESALATTTKKKKKKRVGGIMFAETMTETRIIKDDKEDKEARSLHWKEIQKKSLEPLR
jgi:hypothetical protein